MTNTPPWNAFRPPLPAPQPPATTSTATDHLERLAAELRAAGRVVLPPVTQPATNGEDGVGIWMSECCDVGKAYYATLGHALITNPPYDDPGL